MPQPLVDQLRFTRSEFIRGIRALTDDDARRRIEPMNSISWNIGHLAWQEQQYFVTWPTGQRPFPDIDREFVSGGLRARLRCSESSMRGVRSPRPPIRGWTPSPATTSRPTS